MSVRLVIRNVYGTGDVALKCLNERRKGHVTETKAA